MRALDAFIIEALFQPLHDWVAQLRQRSDYALAMICLLIHMLARDAHSSISAQGWKLLFLLSLTTIVDGAVMFILWGRGYLARQQSHGVMPGLQMPVARTIYGVMVVVWLVLNVLDHTRSAAARITDSLGDVAWIATLYFAGCDLKRPPPKKMKAPVGAAIAAVRS